MQPWPRPPRSFQPSSTKDIEPQHTTLITRTVTLLHCLLVRAPRSCISTMDVVPRQSYVSGIVPAEERTATMGITNIVRSLGAACGPLATGYLSAGGHFG